MNFQKKAIVSFLEVSFLIFLIIAIFTPIIYHNVIEMCSDYPPHIELAFNLLSFTEVMSYPLWHVSFLFINQFFHASVNNSATVLTVFCFIVIGLIIYYIFIIENSKDGINVLQPKFVASRLVLTLSVLIITPIFLFYPLDHLAYLGYIGLTTYHNPTVIICVPFSLLLFYYLVKYFKNPVISQKALLGLVLLTFLSGIAKPSYLICLIPALIIMVIYYLASKKIINLSAIGKGIIIPGFLIIFFQVFFPLLSNQQNRGSIIIAPFVVLSYYSEYLFPKFLLSILFPLLTYILLYKEIHTDISINISWIVFFFGTFYTYILGESGVYLLHGNFSWSSQISLFILFVFSLLFVVKQIFIRQESNRKKIYFLLMIYGIHVIFGIFYYFLVFTGNNNCTYYY